MKKAQIDHYKKALENDADNGDRYFNLGYAYASDNQPVKALEMFAKADEVGCSPNVTGQLYKIMAMLCFDMHRYNDAILNFIKSEKIIGIDMEVLQRKALSYSMRGNAPISKKDGKPIEIHHNEQNPEGPFYEKTQTDHRLGGNYKKNHPNYSEKFKINRSQWAQQKKKYWENEWDAGRWK